VKKEEKKNDCVIREAEQHVSFSCCLLLRYGVVLEKPSEPIQLY